MVAKEAGNMEIWKQNYSGRREDDFSVKNPVAEKVQVTDGIVLDSDGGMHGVGLVNVKAVVDKYGGDFAISCDSEKFQAVVMI